MAEPIRSMLFDLDGTLVDTGGLHFRATNAALEKFDMAIDRATYDREIHGNNNSDIVHYLFPDSGRRRHRRYVEIKEEIFRRHIGRLAPLPGLPEVLDWIRKNRISTALVTNAPAENKDRLLSALGLTDQFDAVILGDELARGKPDPLPYRTALEWLGTAPANAIGFEDSILGIRALKAAEVFTVGVTTGLAKKMLNEAGADMTVADYRDADLWRLIESRGPAPAGRRNV